MDPSIMKLLEEDEDESMHSGADVEAFQAALNRDIGGDVSTSQSSDIGTDFLSQESNQNYSQPFLNWQTPRQDENASDPRQQDPQSVSVQQKQPQQQQQQQHLPVMELKQHTSSVENEQHRNDVSREFNHLQSQKKQSQDGIQQRTGDQFSHQISQATTMRISENAPIPGSEPRTQKMGNQQATGTDSVEQTGNTKSHAKQIPFALLLPALKPHLDKDREMQLQTLFNKLRKNEVTKEQFVRLMRNIVGDQVLRLAVTQLQSQAASNQSQLPSQALSHQHQVRIPVSASSSQFTDSGSFVLHQKGSIPPSDSSHNPPLVVQMQTDAMSLGKNVQKPREAEHQPDSRGIQVSQMTSLVNQERESFSSSSQGNNVQQQHVHFPQTSFPTYGSSGGNYRPYSGTISGASVKPQPHELKVRQISHHQTLGTPQIRGPSQAMSMVKAPKSVKDASKLQSGSISPYANKLGLQQTSVARQAPTSIEQSSSPFSSTNYVKQEPIDQAAEQQQHKSLPSTTPSVSATVPVEQDSTVAANIKDESLEKQSSKVGFSMPAPTLPSVPVSRSITAQPGLNDQLGSRIPSASRAGANTRTPNSKTSIGQKKPLEALGSSPPLPSKKQKVSGAFLDQSIEQLNDVTAVSGVNLREEEEQLFSGPKEDSRASEASRRVVQEEEERMILQKIPLQKKVAEIMAKSGLKNISNDVERCLSMSVEERMRGVISNLIRLSKQRVDVEKTRHRTVITSDVQQQIITLNQKAREEWQKKQAGADKLQNFNEPEGDDRVEGDKEKDEGRVKSVKANKEEDDKMRTTAANVAARAAVGGDDMLSKWQLMAEQARQKREGGMEAASASQPAKDAIRKPLSTTGRNSKDNQEAEKRSPAAVTSASGAVKKFGRNQVIVPLVRAARTISVKDVIAVLEREPQMSKSTMIYRLYERIQSDATSEQ